MATQIIKIDALNPEEEKIRKTVDVLKNSGLVIIPTDTVYGIAADSNNEKALKRLYEIKQRPHHKPFSLLIDKKETIDKLATDLSPQAYSLIDKFWPGALTLILKAKTSGATIGLRMPDNSIALNLISKFGAPLACPSANLSSQSAPQTLEEALSDLDGKVDFAIDAGKTKLGTESTVVDLSSLPFRITREKALKKEEIQKVLAGKTVLFVCTGNSCRSVMAKALLEDRLRKRNRNDLEVLSAGIISLSQGSAPAEVREALKKEGIDLGKHSSLQVTPMMIKKADIILVMERIHEERVLQWVPEAKKRIFLLKEFVHSSRDNLSEGDSLLEIKDPIGKPFEYYEEIFNIIKEAIERLIEIL